MVGLLPARLFAIAANRPHATILPDVEVSVVLLLGLMILALIFFLLLPRLRSRPPQPHRWRSHFAAFTGLTDVMAMRGRHNTDQYSPTADKSQATVQPSAPPPLPPPARPPSPAARPPDPPYRAPDELAQPSDRYPTGQPRDWSMGRVHAELAPRGLVQVDGIIYAAVWRGPRPSPPIGGLVRVSPAAGGGPVLLAFPDAADRHAGGAPPDRSPAEATARRDPIEVAEQEYPPVRRAGTDAYPDS